MTAVATAPSRRWAVVLEAAGLLLVLAATLLVLGRLSSTPWWEYLLSDGDSLALPLLVRSVAEGEPFQWVMTSQLLLFPELPLYLVSLALAGGSVVGALVVNAFVNAAALYGCVRWLAARVLAGRTRPWRVSAAALATGTVVVLAATEGRGLINSGAFASGILLTTYYSGVALAAVLALALMAEASGGFDPARPPSRVRTTWALIGAVLVSAATTLSNPLFALQFTAPAVVSLLAVLVLRRMSWRRALLISAALVAGAGIGYAARDAVARFVAVDAGTYVHLERAGAAVDGFLLQLRDVGSAPTGKLEILIVGVLLLAALVTLVLAVATQVRPETPWAVADSSVVLATFVLVASASLVLGQIVTGSLVSRYLLPLAVFPALMLLPASQDWIPRRLAARVPLLRPRSFSTGVRAALAGAVALVVVAAGVVAGPAVRAAAEQAGSTPERACLEQWLDGRELSGVGSFWSTRPLELYGDASVDVQQVNFDFTAQLWMNNAASYRGKDFSYVLADREPDWAELALGHLGEPAAITACPTFDVYDYAGTPGEAALNAIVGASIEKASAERGF
ncbi:MULTISPECIES: hypothetical protein [unclassified Rathayibacter]|uniref:hypothetical protein n=1 Tax=unclassified Rathayibacter TaxID=2609250 RepID=UPI00104CB5C5|nr:MULTISPECIES: hypothetical protein [unclassified Rathayibacter]MCJ1704790.1 hypothetical protein [Rathayibacter sp. VKM Ac-2926]TCL84594.1 hypothetical protein EDF49_102262 [Rathayibacter sp. PhB192]TCM30312.1 hypothetical protein EDF43_102262 [Rathayibacter sp. PhB179]